MVTSRQFIPAFASLLWGGGKFGVSYVESKDSFQEAIAYANKTDDVHVVIEEYIKGYEVSVETISYHGKHYIIQITDKVSSGPPHFVELAHHQPSSLPQSSINKIHMVVPKLLSQIGYMNGAAHIEMKITEDGKLYLIEVNARGGGDHISDSLVRLSTSYDYIKAMIDVATNSFCEPKVQSIANSGIFFLCKQTSFLLPIFMDADSQPWLVEKNIGSFELVHSVDNYSRNGYIIYKSDHRIQPAIIDNHA